MDSDLPFCKDIWIFPLQQYLCNHTPYNSSGIKKQEVLLIMLYQRVKKIDKVATNFSII